MSGKVKTGEVVPRRSEDEWADVIRADLAASAQGIIGAGRHLVQAKQQIAHGGWSGWLGRELHMNERTAQMLMAVSRNPVLANTNHGSYLPASWRTLYELSRLPDAKLTAAIEAGNVSPDMERKDVAALARPEPAPRDPHADLRGKQTAGKPGKVGKPPVSAGKPVIDREDSEPGPVPVPAGQVQDSVQTGDTGTGAAPATAAEPDPEPCQHCAPQIAELERLLADRSAELETAHTRIRHLEQVRPDMLVLAERDALAEQNAALAERVAELEARLSAPPDGAEQEDPDAGLQTGPEAADWADGALPAPSGRRGRRQVCGNPRASKVRLVVEGRPVRVTMPDGRQAGELWLCAEHVELVTAGGAEADPVDAGPDEDPFGFGEVSPCEYPAPAGVPA